MAEFFGIMGLLGFFSIPLIFGVVITYIFMKWFMSGLKH